ncbi:hypothetical protein DFH08DRAFT_966509 [Mycena albidolilacea]|uniref:Uncharacterized protein n=1 Tax=Mycena albidolilacea TaxID=1033008 RepID=A0AAD6ZP56_9AGAR|nr:hypothetical protein DFH08DRAFT_966509 [Mycena albidolilacea]
MQWMLRQKYPLSSQCYGLPVFEYPLIPGRIYDGRTDPGPDRAVFSNTGVYCGRVHASPPQITWSAAAAPPKAAEELVGAPVAVVRLGVRSTASK